jgi:hypothetical protein
VRVKRPESQKSDLLNPANSFGIITGNVAGIIFYFTHLWLRVKDSNQIHNEIGEGNRSIPRSPAGNSPLFQKRRQAITERDLRQSAQPEGRRQSGNPFAHPIDRGIRSGPLRERTPDLCASAGGAIIQVGSKFACSSNAALMAGSGRQGGWHGKLPSASRGNHAGRGCHDPE